MTHRWNIALRDLDATVVRAESFASSSLLPQPERAESLAASARLRREKRL
jgi:hypothetical protein